VRAGGREGSGWEEAPRGRGNQFLSSLSRGLIRLGGAIDVGEMREGRGGSMGSSA